MYNPFKDKSLLKFPELFLEYGKLSKNKVNFFAKKDIPEILTMFDYVKQELVNLHNFIYVLDNFLENGKKYLLSLPNKGNHINKANLNSECSNIKNYDKKLRKYFENSKKGKNLDSFVGDMKSEINLLENPTKNKLESNTFCLSKKKNHLSSVDLTNFDKYITSTIYDSSLKNVLNQDKANGKKKVILKKLIKDHLNNTV